MRAEKLGGFPRWKGAAVIWFAALLALPLLGALILPGTSEIGEKRAKAECPGRQTGWHAWPASFEACFGDRLGFRSVLIPAHAYLEYRLLRKIANRNVLIGREGWYFYFHNDYNWDEARGAMPFSLQSLHHIKARIEDNRRVLEAEGRKYLFVLAPEKQSIYPEQMTQAYRERERPTRREQFARFVAEVGVDAEVLDLTESLRAQKGARLLFRKTDSHWNPLGMLYAARAVAERLRSPFFGLSERELFGLPDPDDFAVRTDRIFSGDLAGKLGAGNFVFEEGLDLVPLAPMGWANPLRRQWERLNPARDAMRVGMIQDSFGDGLAFYLVQYLRGLLGKSYMFPDDPDGEYKVIDFAWVRAARVQIVIQELSERDLERLDWGEPPKLRAQAGG